MPTGAKVMTLKRRLAAHRRAVQQLAVASRRLHETLDGLITTAHSTHHHGGGASRRLQCAKPKRAGDGVLAPSESERARAAALERHWGNLF